MRAINILITDFHDAVMRRSLGTKKRRPKRPKPALSAPQSSCCGFGVDPAPVELELVSPVLLFLLWCFLCFFVAL